MRPWLSFELTHIIQAGVTLWRRYQGLRVEVVPGGLNEEFDISSLYNWGINTTVVMGIPRILLFYIATRFLGNLSQIYRRRVVEPFSLVAELATVPVHLMNNTAAYYELVDDASGLSKAQFTTWMVDALRGQCRYLDHREVQRLVDICYQQVARQSPKLDIEHGSSKGVGVHLTAKALGYERKQTNIQIELIDQSAFLHCAMNGSGISLPHVVTLFDNDRKLWCLERFFMPRALKEVCAQASEYEDTDDIDAVFEECEASGSMRTACGRRQRIRDMGIDIAKLLECTADLRSDDNDAGASVEEGNGAADDVGGGADPAEVGVAPPRARSRPRSSNEKEREGEGSSAVAANTEAIQRLQDQLNALTRTVHCCMQLLAKDVVEVRRLVVDGQQQQLLMGTWPVSSRPSLSRESDGLSSLDAPLSGAAAAAATAAATAAVKAVAAGAVNPHLEAQTTRLEEFLTQLRAGGDPGPREAARQDDGIAFSTAPAAQAQAGGFWGAVRSAWSDLSPRGTNTEADAYAPVNARPPMHAPAPTHGARPPAHAATAGTDGRTAQALAPAAPVAVEPPSQPAVSGEGLVRGPGGTLDATRLLGSEGGATFGGAAQGPAFDV
eukprot:NODE_555_length_2934_cov_5.915212.p1 GENE.NODE_555_length_2934_cov_5.915212~~NODE_555_length_2934_cov_5.915212.p1  ORF type:complete len:610 (-),score=209.41 NODE_555_length_2934_cov_5.915212:530-2359(-)